MDKKITVLIQAYNEQEDIVECIKSARLLSHTIIVVDTESTDETAQLAKKNGVQVCSFPFARYVAVSYTHLDVYKRQIQFQTKH